MRTSAGDAGRTNCAVARTFAGLPPDAVALDVLRRAAETLAEHVPAEYWCGVLLDPSTLLDTGGLYTASFPDHVMPRLFEIEHVEHLGADNLRALARRPSTVSLLSRSTRGLLDGDVYYRDILAPLGMVDEMRVVLRQGRTMWGLLVWARSAPFRPVEVELATALAGPTAESLRVSFLLRGRDDGDVADAPGLVLLGGDGAVVTATPTALRWLHELQEDHPVTERLPNTVRALAIRDARCRTTSRRSSARWGWGAVVS